MGKKENQLAAASSSHSSSTANDPSLRVSLLSLPIDVLETVFSHCDPPQLRSLLFTCRKVMHYVLLFICTKAHLLSKPSVSYDLVTWYPSRMFVLLKCIQHSRQNPQEEIKKLSSVLGCDMSFPYAVGSTRMVEPSVRDSCERLSVERETRELVARLGDTSLGDAQRDHVCDQLYSKCHSKVNSDLYQCYQEALARSDAVSVLFATANSPSSSLSLRSHALKLLGQMCFRNFYASRTVGYAESLVPTVTSILTDSSATATLKSHAIYSIIAPVNNVWEIHPRFRPLIPILVQMMRQETDERLRGMSVLCIGALAYNEASRETLVQCGAIGPLLEIVRAKDTHLRPTSAALAVANLAQIAGDQVSDESFADISRDLSNAMEATLRGDAYPANSSVFYTPWKVAMSICNLSQSRGVVSLARFAPRLPSLLTSAIFSQAETNVPPDQRLVFYSILALWNISPFSTRPATTCDHPS